MTDSSQGAAPSRWKAVQKGLTAVWAAGTLGWFLWRDIPHLLGGLAQARAGGAADWMEFAADLCLTLGLVGLAGAMIAIMLRAPSDDHMAGRLAWIGGGALGGLWVLSLGLRIAAGGVTREAVTSPGSLLLVGGLLAIGGAYWLLDRYWIRPSR